MAKMVQFHVQYPPKGLTEQYSALTGIRGPHRARTWLSLGRIPAPRLENSAARSTLKTDRDPPTGNWVEVDKRTK